MAIGLDPGVRSELLQSGSHTKFNFAADAPAVEQHFHHQAAGQAGRAIQAMTGGDMYHPGHTLGFSHDIRAGSLAGRRPGAQPAQPLAGGSDTQDAQQQGRDRQQN
jgi:hypothetical protein